MGYFDGAANAGRCGDGMHILVDIFQHFRLHMGTGLGTNTRSELLALWGLLYFDLHKNFRNLHVRGDSKVIIEWALGNYDIHSMELEH